MRILLDTSFLLPSMGVEITGASEILGRLKGEDNELYYSNFSLLEGLWVLLSLERKGIGIELETIEVGLRSIEQSYTRATEDVGIFLQALNLRRAGHTDIVDCLLYSISLREDLRFVSFDSELREFLCAKGLKDTLLIP